MIFFLGFMLFIFPLILTVLNIINLFKKKSKGKVDVVVDILIFVFGIGYTLFLYFALGFRDYQKPLVEGGPYTLYHAPIASWSIPTVIALLLLGVISYLLIRIKKLDLPPLIIVGSMSGIFICSLYMIVFMIQLSKNFMDIVDLIPYF